LHSHLVKEERILHIKSLKEREGLEGVIELAINQIRKKKYKNKSLK
jgi:hypothetical protein